MLAIAEVQQCYYVTGATDFVLVVLAQDMARYEAYRHLVGRGFRTEIQGVTMHRPNEPGYSRAGVFVLDDWR